MTTARLLMIASELLAGTALVVQYFLPPDVGVTFTISADRIIAIPIRWFLPLLLIAFAGTLSLAAIVKMCWALAHVPIPK